MEWQTVVLIVAVLATCCFYRWCSVKSHETDNHKMFAQLQFQAQQMQHEQFLIEHGRGSTDD